MTTAIATVVIEDGIITIPPTMVMDIFSSQANADDILARLRKEVDSHPVDLATKKGRDAVASLSRKVSSSKVVLVNLAKGLTEDWKNKSKAVDTVRLHIERQCDILRDEARKPLTDWEEAEEKRADLERQALKLLADEAAAYADHAIFLRLKELEAKEAELNRIESERLAKEEAARIEAARIESERIQKEKEAQRINEAAEKARKGAEERAAAEIQSAREREHNAKVEAEAQRLDAQRAASLAEERRIAAERAAKVAQEKAVQEAHEQAKFAAQVAESNRIAAEETSKRETFATSANVEHRRAINHSALSSLVELGILEESAKKLIGYIVAGKVAHITINY